MFSRENNDSHKEERYQFMREQVKPQRKKQCLIWAKRLGILIVSACIFGGIAGGAICLITSRAKKNSTRNVVKINTYSATAAATAEPQETPATGGSNNSSRLTTENMNRMSEQLAAIGGQASASIVGKIKQMRRIGFQRSRTTARMFHLVLYIRKILRTTILRQLTI